MIEIYGKSYATADEAAQIAGDQKSSVNGTYKLEKHLVVFTDFDGTEKTFIRDDGLGPNSIGRSPEGKRVYMFGTTDPDMKWMGFPESYMEQVEAARVLAKSLFPNPKKYPA